jgi:hypothetical protein
MSRPYLVENKTNNEKVLIEANSQVQAINVYNKNRLAVTTPNAMEVANLLSNQGVKFIAQEQQAISAETANAILVQSQQG